MEKVFSRPHSLTDVPLHYCPGCPHGIVHRLVAEVIEAKIVDMKWERWLLSIQIFV